MARVANKDKRKKRVRPATGTVALRLPRDTVAAIDAWAKREGAASRPAAILLLLELATAGTQRLRKRSNKSASQARTMAAEELDRLGDQSLPDEERERRKRRLTKGPTEFRDMRGDQPKPKRT
jgi:hypothetical protein